jgi:hypothetical protein
VQDALGALNDRSVRRSLVEAVAHGDPDQVRAVTRIALSDDEDDLLETARKALRDLLHAKPFW